MTLRMCEIVSDTTHLPTENIQEIINQHCNTIDKWVWITHDKDKNADGSEKYVHNHVYLHFTCPQKLEFVAKWFGVGENFVSKIKGKFADAVEYAQHKNAPEKYQYPDSAVKANFDFVKVVETNQKEKEKRASIAQIIEGIDTGEIKQYNIVDKVSVSDYVRYEKQIKRAFEYRQKKQERLVDRNMEVVYIYGASGTGKTTYAKMIAEEKGYSVFTSSGSNDPFYGYAGQECVILDDLRGSVFPLSDLLKILDNHTNSTVKARYRNVSLECKILIITTTKSMQEFYKQVFESNGEEFKQFMRRCGQVCYLTKDEATLFWYDKERNGYIELTKVPNPVKTKIKMSEYEKEQSKKRTLELFGILSDSINGISEMVEKSNENGGFDGETIDLSEFEEIIGDDE